MAKKILGMALLAAAALMPLAFMMLHHFITESWGDGYPVGMTFTCVMLMIFLGCAGADTLGFDLNK